MRYTKNRKYNFITVFTTFLLMFSLILGECGAVSKVKAQKKENAKDYGVFLSLDSSKIKKLYGYKTVVIDAEYFSAKDIRKLHKKGIKVYTYLNVGSLENFRSYYKKYKNLTIGDYENWEEEKWIDVSYSKWSKFIKQHSEKFSEKGVDGFFIDNCDVYYYVKSNFGKEKAEKCFRALSNILKNIRKIGKAVVINGGDVFVKRYQKLYGSAKDIMTAVNQETVLSRINFKSGKFGKQYSSERKYFSNYVKQCKKDGMEVYLLEYTKNRKLIRQIQKYCQKNKFHYYISDSIELD